MKRFFAVLLTVTTMMTVAGFAGEKGSCSSKKAKSCSSKVAMKSCSAEAQACIDKIAGKMANMSYDGIYVKGVGTGTLTVVNVEEGSPGAEAGIQKGDILAKMDGQKLGGLDKKAFFEIMTNVNVGQEVTYAVQRGEKWIKTNVTMTGTPKATIAKQIGSHLMAMHNTEKSEAVAVN